MTRIRYDRYANKLVNKEPVLLGTELIQVTLDLGTLTYEIKTIDTNRIVATGDATSAAYLKMKVKKLLRQLGVNFNDEIRNTSKVKKLTLEDLASA